jgi:hypothetical protein
MTDHENELITGAGQDGKPVKVAAIEDEGPRIWAEAQENAKSGKSVVTARLLEKIREVLDDGEGAYVFDAKALGVTDYEAWRADNL